MHESQEQTSKENFDVEANVRCTSVVPSSRHPRVRRRNSKHASAMIYCTDVLNGRCTCRCWQTARSLHDLTPAHQLRELPGGGNLQLRNFCDEGTCLCNKPPI